MGGRARALVKLSYSLYSPIRRYPITELASPISGFQAISPLSTSSSSTTTIVEGQNKTSSKSQRDSLLPGNFRLRNLKGSSETEQGNPQASSNSTAGKVIEKGLQKDSLFVKNFRLRKLKGSSETVQGNPQAPSNSSAEKVIEKGLQKDSVLLEKFRLRKLKGSSKTVQGNPRASSNSTAEKVIEKGLQNEGEPTQQITKFKDLGLSEELILALKAVGVFSPSEIQCVGIPAVLDGKNVLLSSQSGYARTLAYLLPLIQLLRRDAKLRNSKSQQPQAILLCASEEKAEECFNVAKLIIHNAEVTSAKDVTLLKNELSNVSIGLVIGTPTEVLQYIEEGTVIPDEIRYLVLDEADCVFHNGLGPEIHKITRALNDRASESTIKGLQTVLVTSTISEILGEQSSIVKRLEHDHGGQISAMVLEMDKPEVFQITESLDAIREKMAEAMDSLMRGL